MSVENVFDGAALSFGEIPLYEEKDRGKMKRKIISWTKKVQKVLEQEANKLPDFGEKMNIDLLEPDDYLNYKEDSSAELQEIMTLCSGFENSKPFEKDNH